MSKFHCIGMKDPNGKGRDDSGEVFGFDAESHAAGLLYLEKAEGKISKMSRKRFNKLWDRELIKLADRGYNRYPYGAGGEREQMAFAYLAGRNCETYGGRYRDIYVHGQCDRIAAAV